MTKILIVEDRFSMRQALRGLFERCRGWDVCGEAEDGYDAVVQAKRLNPDIVVMDYRMHNSDGLKAAAELTEVMPALPVIMFTLYKTDQLEAAAKQAGVRCVVGKEDGVQTLLRAIESQLPM